MTVHPGVADTVLTDRQAEVLSLRGQGLTQREIADRFGTSIANVSAIERAARDNVDRARRTLTLARFVGAPVRFRVEAGSDLRDIVDRVYAEADAAGIHVTHTDPELSTHLQAHLDEWLGGRELTDDVDIGVTEDGEVVTHPSAVLIDRVSVG